MADDPINANVRVTIVDTCEGIESGTLEWNLVDDDNSDPECYLVGSEYYVRLYKTPESLDQSAYAINGSVYFDSEQTEDITDEYVVFSGTQTSNLKNVFLGNFSYKIIGNVISDSGVSLPSIAFTISPGDKGIAANIPCYAILKVSYKTKYYRYKFVGVSEGKILLIALATHNGESVSSSYDITVYEDCDKTDLCADISLEIDTSSEEGSSYGLENKKLIKIYGIEKENVAVYVTRGSLQYLGSEDVKVEDEEIAVINRVGRLNKKVLNIISQTITGGNITPLTVDAYGGIQMSEEASGETVAGIPFGYGTVKVTYTTRALKFVISSETGGKGILIAQEITTEDCSLSYIEYQFEEDEEDTLYDITVSYADFVTGDALPDVSVWVDGIYKGKTDSEGKLEVKQVSVNVKHTIKATKAGYLDTDSDSLANDTFIIRSS